MTEGINLFAIVAYPNAYFVVFKARDILLAKALMVHSFDQISSLLETIQKKIFSCLTKKNFKIKYSDVPLCHVQSL